MDCETTILYGPAGSEELALAGGFVRVEKTHDEAALRELQETIT